MKTTKTPVRRLLVAGAAGAGLAAVANAVIFGLGRSADVDYVISQTSTGVERIAVTDVVGFTLMSFAVGLLAALIARWWNRPSLRTVQIVGSAVAVLSVAMDLPIDGSTAAKVSLASMHLVVGLAFVVAVHIAGRARASQPVTAPALESHFEPVAA
jgi:Family of unknown function (DUF6069)